MVPQYDDDDLSKQEPSVGNKRLRKLPPRKPPWNAWQALFLLALVNLIEWPLGWLQPSVNLDTGQGIGHFLLVGFGEAVLYLAILLLAFALWRYALPLLGLVPAAGRSLIAGIGYGTFLFFAIGLLGNYLTKLFGTPPPQSFALAVQGASHNWELVLLLVLGGLVAPLKEELIFRGMLYPPLRQAYGRGLGIILTSLVFALLHLDFVRFIPLFLGGVMLAWLYERTGSLWPSIIAHGTWNTLMAVALWLQR